MYNTIIFYISIESGKKAEVMQKLLATEISHAVYYQPSILFFDDIESVTSATSNTEENTPDSMNAARYKLIHKYISCLCLIEIFINYQIF